MSKCYKLYLEKHKNTFFLCFLILIFTFNLTNQIKLNAHSQINITNLNENKNSLDNSLHTTLNSKESISMYSDNLAIGFIQKSTKFMKKIKTIQVINKEITSENVSSINNNDHNNNDKTYYYLWYLPKTESFLYSSSKKKIKTENESEEYLAVEAVYSKTIEKTGWHQLQIETFNKQNKVNSLLQCYGAGYIEGRASYREIKQYFNNIHVFFSDYGEEGMKKIYDTLEIMYNSLIDKISSEEFFNKLHENGNSHEIKKWTYITCIVSQLEGIFSGFNFGISNDKEYSDKEKELFKMSMIDFLLLNSEGNYGDIKDVVDANDLQSEKGEDFSTEENLIRVFNTSDINKIWKNLTKKSHCSVLLKFIRNDKTKECDIIAGHDTWTSYSELIRTLKTYTFEFESNTEEKKENDITLNEKKAISFSSYPGVLFSGDDFYVLDNQVVLLQTTLNVINKFKYKDIIDFKNYIPEFIRIMTSNLLSKDAKNWIDNFSDYENHLYITQWIVIDYKRLNSLNDNLSLTKSNKELEDLYNSQKSIVFILDETPGIINSEDITKKLFSSSYFGSFNMPYFESSIKSLGYNKFNISFDDPIFNPRNKIYKYLEQSITDLDSFEKAITYNGYKKDNPDFPDDPSKHDPANGIMSRYDILDSTLSGGVDFKIVDRKLVKQLKFKAKAGPTTSNNLKCFELDDKSVVSLKFLEGIPKKFDFNTIVFEKE